MSPGEPRRLGRYELLELLGHGAMGVVYKAHDSFLDRTVAVKTYRQDVPITEQVRKRFEREVRTASKLNHPNIVVVHDGGLEQDVPYLAMEYVEGPTLAAELTRRGRLPTAEALTLIEKIADGLAYAHAHGVVHRDLKPANILLAGGTPKIADFGVAKLMTADATATTAPVGTPSYMAPEQIEGKPIDARSDVFALGILTYQLLTGRAPFGGEGWTAVMFQIMNVEPEQASKIDPSLPGAVDEVIARALAKDPTKRTADARPASADASSSTANGRAARAARRRCVRGVSRPRAEDQGSLGGRPGDRSRGAAHRRAGDDHQLSRLAPRRRLAAGHASGDCDERAADDGAGRSDGCTSEAGADRETRGTADCSAESRADVAAASRAHSGAANRADSRAATTHGGAAEAETDGGGPASRGTDRPARGDAAACAGGGAAGGEREA